MQEKSSSQDPFVVRFEHPPYQEGSLSSLTFAVKDVIDVACYKTGGGNPTWEKTHPVAVAHAVCVDQLLHTGASCVGKTVTDELAFSLLGENFFYGTPLNPKAPNRVPGGSSSGSASVVSAGLADFALGTDTGGSVRVPASNCGIFGFRPTTGRISLAGVNPLAPSFDTVGVFAQRADILTKVSSVLLGTTLKKLESAPTLLILEDAFAWSDPEIQTALRAPLESLSQLYPTQHVSLEDIFHQSVDFDMLRQTYCSIQWAECWSSLGSWIEIEKPQFGSAAEKSFSYIRDCMRFDLQKSWELRASIKKRLQHFLDQGQMLCIPTTSSLAPLKGTIPCDRIHDTYYTKLLGLTSLAGLGSLPQVTLPLGQYETVPVGLSLLTTSYSDEKLLQAVLQIESYVSNAVCIENALSH